MQLGSGVLWGKLLSSGPNRGQIILVSGSRMEKYSVWKYFTPYWASPPWVTQGLQPGPGTLPTVAKAAEMARRRRLDLLSSLHLAVGVTLSTPGSPLHFCLGT